MLRTAMEKLGRYLNRLADSLLEGAAWGVGFVCVLALAKHFRVL